VTPEKGPPPWGDKHKKEKKRKHKQVAEGEKTNPRTLAKDRGHPYKGDQTKKNGDIAWVKKMKHRKGPSHENGKGVLHIPAERVKCKWANKKKRRSNRIRNTEGGKTERLG